MAIALGSGQLRSGKVAFFFVGSVILIAAIVGILYNHLDFRVQPTSQDKEHKSSSKPDPAPAAKPPPPPPADDAESSSHEDYIRKYFIEQTYRSRIAVNSTDYRPYGAFGWKLPSEAKWNKPMGEKLCIVDLDNRPFNEANQVFGSDVMSWDNADKVHGLSMGIMNHWLYAKIHGYKYYYVKIESPEDRRSSWMKAPVISKILQDHDTCLYLDNDAIFKHLDLPFEWLMNYWELDPNVDSMALAADPASDWNSDKFGKVYLNTGFIISQNNKKTMEIMDDWWHCPEDGGRHPDCKEFRFAEPGRPTDQGGFGTYIRYDYASNIKELPCTEANGFTEAGSGCDGTFISHLWTGKHDWIKLKVGEQIPGTYLELFHKQLREEKKDFYIEQEELLGSKN